MKKFVRHEDDLIENQRNEQFDLREKNNVKQPNWLSRK